MIWLKRISLFLGVNFLVLLSVSLIANIFHITPSLHQQGLSYSSLLLLCFIWGMVGSLVSLALSKFLAKWLMGVKLIDPLRTSAREGKILEITYRLAQNAGLQVMPEVGIFHSTEVNAFATGPSKNNSLVALSSAAVDHLNEGELSAIIGHELTHIANGDMVTMTLLQGIINTFVMFFARVVALIITRGGQDQNQNRRGGSPFAFMMTVWVLECIFMALGSIIICFFSRKREFKADIGGARLAGKSNMIQALQFLKKEQEEKLISYDHARSTSMEAPQGAFNAFKISSSEKFLHIFSTHPPLETRIEHLQKMKSKALS